MKHNLYSLIFCQYYWYSKFSYLNLTSFFISITIILWEQKYVKNPIGNGIFVFNKHTLVWLSLAIILCVISILHLYVKKHQQHSSYLINNWEKSKKSCQSDRIVLFSFRFLTAFGSTDLLFTWNYRKSIPHN